MVDRGRSIAASPDGGRIQLNPEIAMYDERVRRSRWRQGHYSADRDGAALLDKIFNAWAMINIVAQNRTAQRLSE